MRTKRYIPFGPGIPGTKATNKVKKRDPRYMIVAFLLVSDHILPIWAVGPLKKQLPQRAMIFPTVAFSTNGTMVGSCNEQKGQSVSR